MVTLSPPTSEAGVRSPSWPQVGKLVVASSRMPRSFPNISLVDSE